MFYNPVIPYVYTPYMAQYMRYTPQKGYRTNLHWSITLVLIHY